MFVAEIGYKNITTKTMRLLTAVGQQVRLREPLPVEFGQSGGSGGFSQYKHTTII